MSLTFSSAARSDVGLVRENNEDTGCAGPTLLAVADGMGGHAAGEVASSVVMYALREHSEDHTPEAITQAVERAQGALQAMSLVDPDLDGMGTTLVALAVGPQGVSLAHIGDSRIYRLRDGCLDQITTDHTHVQRLVEAGRLTSAQARHHPYRSVILRSIDDTHADLPDVNLTEQLADGDRVLLCSDGLSDYLTDAQLAGILSHGSPAVCAEALVTAALQAGTRDNVTVVVADARDADSPAEPAAPRAEGTEGSDVVTVGARVLDAPLSAAARAVLAETFPALASALTSGTDPETHGATPEAAAGQEPAAPQEATDRGGDEGSEVPAAARQAVRSGAAPRGREESRAAGFGAEALSAGNNGVRRADLGWIAFVALSFVATTATVWFTAGG
ncbi:protein phosphatase 2C domain-containing protein [Serinibacter salmoneus]|uniref:Protein phosphatase n=1 Tax=Serinibacter salmoneus TaxID=556530 RepID=A0A2A9D348_9MICO|nr:protein phosphatase 2C domain-containing protein [Serinibacter salmoneus]PFG21084.1 protein phosphatase [Serinibacter salmoneus]